VVREQVAVAASMDSFQAGMKKAAAVAFRMAVRAVRRFCLEYSIRSVEIDGGEWIGVVAPGWFNRS
jgi:hypothetical protein